MIKLINLLKENINIDTVYTYRSQKSLPDIKSNGIKMGDNKSNSQFFELPDYGYSYYTSTSKDSNWIDFNPFGDENTPYTVRVSINLDKIKNDKNYDFKELDIPDHPEYQEVRIYSNTKNRIPPEYIKSIDILRRKSGDPQGTGGWYFDGTLNLEPEVKKYINNIFKNNSNLDSDSFPYDEMYDYFTEFWDEDSEYDDVSKEVANYIESKVN
jgi:hypothetical protein